MIFRGAMIVFVVDTDRDRNEESALSLSSSVDEVLVDRMVKSQTSVEGHDELDVIFLCEMVTNRTRSIPKNGWSGCEHGSVDSLDDSLDIPLCERNESSESLLLKGVMLQLRLHQLDASVEVCPGFVFSLLVWRRKKVVRTETMDTTKL